MEKCVGSSVTYWLVVVTRQSDHLVECRHCDPTLELRKIVDR
uniref:Uncharacterized protein n=1 Tax=Anguilla anguilla TaxID=7936 RepID=A0A0E9Q4U0_ANGAN